MVSTAAEDLRRSYRVAFLRFLPRRDEAALLTGYDIGRQALSAGVGTATIAAAHHAVLSEALAGLAKADDAGPVLASAELFLAERAPAAQSERGSARHGERRQHLPARQAEDIDAAFELADQHAAERDTEGRSEREEFGHQEAGTGIMEAL